MSTFDVDATRPIDTFLRRNGFQQYKILLLIGAGAVARLRDGETPHRIDAANERVEAGDTVVVNETNALFQKKLNDLKSTDFRDYVFSTDRDQFFKDMAALLHLRGDNIQLAAKNLVDFVKALSSDPQVSSPIRHLFFVSHASVEGFLFTALDVLDTKSITYEDLEKVGNRISIDPKILQPRPKDDKGNVISPMLHIRGCEIGNAAPYMQKLKAALGNSIQVTAPRFFHVVETIKSPPGRIEYMLYHFAVFSPDPFLKRADLLDAFDKRKFKDVDQVAIPKQNWDSWVPASNFTRAQQVVLAEVVSPVDKKKTKVKGYFRYLQRFFLKDFKIHLPADKRKSKDRRDLLLGQIRAWPTMQPGHPFPVYARLGYKSFDDFADGWSWRFVPAGDQFSVSIFRNEYSVLQPVVDGSTRTLFLNFFASGGLRPPPAPVITLPDADQRFFGVY